MQELIELIHTALGQLVDLLLGGTKQIREFTDRAPGTTDSVLRA